MPVADREERTRISKQRVLANSASSAGLLLLNLSVMLWVQQRLIQRISEDEYALLPVVVSFLSFAPLLTQILVAGLGRYITVAYAQGDDEQIRRLTSTMMPVLLVTSVGIMAIGFFCTMHIDVLIRVSPEYLGKARWMFALMVGSTAIQLPLALFASGLVMTQRMALQDGINAVGQTIKIVLLLSLLLGVSTNVVWVVVSTVSGELFAAVCVAIISARLVPAQLPSKNYFTPSLVRELLGYGTWSFVEQVSHTARQAMDPIILNRFSSVFQVATFQAGGIAPRQINVLLGPLLRPFIPVMATFHATGDMPRMANTYLRVARYNVAIFAAIAIPAIIYAKDLMFLYLGGKYPGSGLVMMILVLVPLLSGFNALGPTAVLAQGKVRELSLRQLGVQGTNLALTLLFVAYWDLGAAGCAAASVLATLTAEAGLIWAFCRKSVGVGFGQWLGEVVVPNLVPTLATVGLGVFLKSTITTTSWSVVLLGGAALGVLYLALFLRWGRREEDVRSFAGLVRRLPAPAARLLNVWMGPP